MRHPLPKKAGPHPGSEELPWLSNQLRRDLAPHACGTALLLGATLLSLVDPLIIKWLLDSGLRERRWGAILLSMGLFCVVYLLRSVLLSSGTWRIEKVRQRMTLRLRRALLLHLQRLDARFFDRNPIGDLVQRIEADVEEVGHTAATLLPTMTRVVLAVGMTLVIMAVLDWRLTLCVLPFVPLLLFLRQHFRRALELRAGRVRAMMGERASFLHEYINDIVQFKLHATKGFFSRRFGRLSVGAARADLEQRRTELWYHATSLGVMTLGTVTVLLAGAYEYMVGVITLGGYVAFYSYLMRLFDPVSAAVDSYARIKRAGGSIRRILDVQRAEPSVHEGPLALQLTDLDAQRVECRKLEFGYSGEPVLHDIHLDLVPGSRLALIGRSGSGKSTLAHLLVRFYDPQRGHAFVNGEDMRRLRLRSLHHHVALVPSKPVLFRGTLRENVLLGRSVECEEQLNHLAWVSCFDSVVGKFPARWEHALGPDGAGLSDGEKQRLGLLRALVGDRAVLILDEPTSALDPGIESELLGRLGEYTRDRLVLVITHREATARWADRVLLLRDGRLYDVVEPASVGAFSTAFEAMTGDLAFEGKSS